MPIKGSKSTWRPMRTYVLPDPDTLPFPGNLIRACQNCGLSAKCKAPVPGENVDPFVDIAFVGQNPGKSEDEQGRPFIGQAGQYLDSLLLQVRILREDVSILNLVKCLTPSNRAPKANEIAACSPWLEVELKIIRPRIIVAMGYPATAYFLGTNAGTMEQLHGKPILLNDRYILPVYHPAAALHDTGKLRQCTEDFQALRKLVDGASHLSFHIKDEYPEPDYRVADSPRLISAMRDEVMDTGEFGLDTETCRGKLWSYQVSARPGTGWFVPLKDDFQGRVDFTDWPSTAIVHNYLYDIQFVRLREDGFFDTMVMAYLVGAPQGLKELANRLCGIKMINYNEIVRPGQQKLSMEYLFKALKQEWPDPPSIEETKWDNKKGEIVTKQKNPWHISRKMNNMLNDMEDNYDLDLWSRWQQIPAPEREVVERVLGPMPESSLADIPFDQAVAYAIRDSDATLRVYHRLREMIKDLRLDYTLYMDLRILPMVDAMMRNGMAVDLGHYRKLSKDYDRRLRLKASELADMVGHAFNPASSQQVATVVYGELGFDPTKRTATGLISTDDAELKKTKHPVAEGVIRYRGIQKLKGTYADALTEWATPDEQGTPRVHTTLKTTRVATGRLACVPTDTEILTRFGWRSRDTITVGDVVLGYNIVADELVWTTIKAIHSGRSVVGTLKLGRRQRAEDVVRCTGNHKWVMVFQPHWRRRVPDGVRCIMEAQHIGYSRTFAPVLFAGKQAQVGGSAVTPVESAVVGWAITDGHRIVTSSGRSALSIRLVKESSIKMVRELLRNVEHQEHHYASNGIEATDFYVGVAAFDPVWNRFSQAGAAVYVLHLTDDAQHAMFDAMFEADGSRGAGRRGRWAKREDSDATQAMELLAFLLGKRYTSRFYTTHHGTRMREFHFLGDQLYGANASFVQTDETVVDVWCPETKMGTWVARQGRHVFITGNSADPNLQNIPTRNKEAKAIKNGFIAPPSWLLVEGDYAQIEMCTQAHLARCKGLIELFNRGGDPHTETAAKLFNVPLDEAAKSKYRYPCKRAGFGIIYMIGSHGLSTQINEYIADLAMDGEPVDIEPWSEDRCGEFIEEYYKLYPEIRKYQRRQLILAKRYGYVRDLFGRIRYIPEVMCPVNAIQEAGARMAANHPVTASAQGIIKTAMGRLWEELPETEWDGKVRWLVQIHDSLLIELCDDPAIVNGFLPWMRQVMTGVVRLLVPVKVGFKLGKRWGGMTKCDI